MNCCCPLRKRPRMTDVPPGLLNPLCYNLLTNSLDNLVGTAEDRLRDRDAKRLRRLEVDDQLKLGWLLDWQISRFCALQNSPHVIAGLPARTREAGPVAHQPAGHDELTPCVGRRNP